MCIIICYNVKNFVKLRVIKFYSDEVFLAVRLGMPEGYLLLTQERRGYRVKWLNTAIKILHFVAMIGTYAAFFEIILTAVRAVLNHLGF